MILANAIITKYLDYKYFIVLQSCYRGVTGCHIMCESVTTKIKTGLDLFLFLMGLLHVGCHTLKFLRNHSQMVMLPQISMSDMTLFFGWCHM